MSPCGYAPPCGIGIVEPDRMVRTIIAAVVIVGWGSRSEPQHHLHQQPL